MTTHHVIVGVLHVVHVIFEELTGSHKFCTYCLPRRKCIEKDEIKTYSLRSKHHNSPKH